MITIIVQCSECRIKMDVIYSIELGKNDKSPFPSMNKNATKTCYSCKKCNKTIVLKASG